MNEAASTMSIWQLVIGASLPVQIVMLLLFTASVVSWMMIVQRGIYQRNALRTFQSFEREFWSGIDLNQLYRQGNEKVGKGGVGGIENIFRAGFKEFTRLRQKSTTDPDAVMQGTERAMRVALSREEEKLESNLPFLASVASVSPYVGLFGTVWGIMNSFIGLAGAQQATLQSVAPGIAEALIATAIGLFAAIPAVLAYNRFATRAAVISNYYRTFAEEFSSILHRQVHSK